MAIATNSVHAEQKTDAILLTPRELAERLSVPVSWIREKTRKRAQVRDEGNVLPCLRLGKYIRFRWSDVEAWLEKQSQ